MVDERGAKSVGTQGVGGLDVGTQLSGLFAKLNEKNEEIFQQHLNILTAIQKKLVGDYGAPSENATQLAQGATRAWKEAHMLSPNGNVPVGVTVSQDLQQSAPTPPGMGSSTTAQSLEGMLTQDMLRGGGGGYNGGGSTRSSSPMHYQPRGGTGFDHMVHGIVHTGSRLGSLLPGALGKAAGGIGLAYEGYNLLNDEYRNQVNANLWYRANAGQSQGNAMWDRFRGMLENSDLFNPFDVLSSGERTQATQDALAMGYRKNDQAGHYYTQEGSMNLDRLAKSQLGFSVSQTDALKQAALENGGETGLTNLIKDLHDLQDAAGKAGANVQKMTANAMVYGQQLSAMYGTNVAAAGQAGAAVANQQTAFGTQGIAGNALNSPGFNVMATAMAGGTLGTMYSSLMQNPQGAQYSELKATQGMADSLLRGIFGSSFDDFVNNIVPQVNANPGQIQTILQSWSAWSGMVPQAMPGIATTLGASAGSIGNDPVKAVAWIIQQYYGANSLLAKSKQSAMASATTNAQGVITSGQFKGQRSPDHGLAGLAGVQAISRNNAALGEAYGSYASSTGKYSPGLATMLSDMSSHQGAGFVIHTAKGPVQISATDIFKPENRAFLSQVMAGQATITNAGQFSGMNLEQIASGLVDTSQDDASMASAKLTTRDGKVLKGKALTQALGYGHTGTDKMTSQTVGGVTITLDPSVAQYFNIQKTSGNWFDASNNPRPDTQTVYGDAMWAGNGQGAGGGTPYPGPMK